MTRNKRRTWSARYQRELRRQRDAEGTCRTCGDEVAISERTGLPTRQCPRHLGCDLSRKMVYILPWETKTPLRQALAARLEYPLGALP